MANNNVFNNQLNNNQLNNNQVNNNQVNNNVFNNQLNNNVFNNQLNNNQVNNNQVNNNQVNNNNNVDYPIDIKSNVPFELRTHDLNTQVGNPPTNGGLYSGPQNDAPWMPKSIPATTTYFIQNLLKNADPPPPPGATEQYPGENRLGNNYTPMPGVNWYNTPYERNKGPFNIKVMNDKPY